MVREAAQENAVSTCRRFAADSGPGMKKKRLDVFWIHKREEIVFSVE